MNKCAVKITDWLIGCNAIPESDRELYEYALYSIFLTISPVLIAITVGFFFKTVTKGILIILPFVVIRKYSGGYHTKKPGVCLVASSLILVLCMMLSFFIQCRWWGMCLVAVSVASLAYFSPVDNENRLLKEEERKGCKKKTAMIASTFFVVVMLLHFLGFHVYEVSISMGIILSACLQVPAVISEISKKNS